MKKSSVLAMLAAVVYSGSLFAHTGGWPKIPQRPGPVVPPPLHILTSAAVAKVTCMSSGSVTESVALFTPEDVQNFKVLATDSDQHTVSIQSKAIDRAQDAACKLELSEQDLATRSAVLAL